MRLIILFFANIWNKIFPGLLWLSYSIDYFDYVHLLYLVTKYVYNKGIYCRILLLWGFLSGSGGKESARNAGNPGSILGSGRSPGEVNGYPLLYSCLENSMDRGSWPGPWGCKELDMIKWLTVCFFFHCYFQSYRGAQEIQLKLQ